MVLIMWRVNIMKMYLSNVAKLGKFYTARKYSLEDGEQLIFQLPKSEEPGRFIGRVCAIGYFGSWSEGVTEESRQHYNRNWGYAINLSQIRRLNADERFNLLDVLGETRSKRYDGQSPLVKFEEEDERDILSAKRSLLLLH
jgi:hypothetical protein